MHCLTRAVFLAILGLTFAVACPVNAEQIIGLTTGNALVSFDSATPGTASAPIAVTGLQAGETLLGIDRRPETGALYGLGSSNRLYTINPTTGAATGFPILSGSVALSGSEFGIDFNPVVDRLRVVSNTGQNLRLNPNDGSLTAVDANLNPGTPRVVGAAYTNNFPGAITTTLYDIDSSTDSLMIQSPPNNGTLTLVGPLGVNTSDLVGFDVSGQSEIAYASLTAPTGAASQLYVLNLTSGAATLVGTVGTGFLLRDIAAPVGAPVLEPATLILLGVGLGGMVAAAARRR